MANFAQETTVYPFTAFRFAVEIVVPALSPDPLCNGAFAECDGLEMSMDVKTIREGGNNAGQVRLFGPVNYGTLTLKRGMTANFDLWNWFNTLYQPNKALTRGQATVVVFAADGTTERVRFLLENCLPQKLKAPVLNAREGTIAIEEMQLAYESMSLKRPA